MISKEATIKNNFGKSILFANSARSCFEHLLRNLTFAKDEIILMPSYIGETDTEGSGVFDPVRKTGVNYIFYELEADLSINLNDFQQKISSGKVKAVLVIHYFGFCQLQINAVKALCKKNNVFLIEDCAHSLYSLNHRMKPGSYGDFSFYSIHKLLPTTDGGFLHAKNNSVEISEIDIRKKISLETLESYCTISLEKTSEIRIKNYNYYLELLPEVSGKMSIMFPKLPKGIVPLNFPILIHSNKREKVYFKLIDAGIITCALYYRLIPEINKKIFPLSYEISEKILNLPVHQDTKKSDVLFIARNLNEILKEL
jgi:dTDP-4-amino-4,6-dideoxygalactose transaminase